jgi:hypothetical protein
MQKLVFILELGVVMNKSDIGENFWMVVDMGIKIPGIQFQYQNRKWHGIIKH